MKKLLGILVLGLLLSGNAYAEEIILDCKGESVTVDGKSKERLWEFLFNQSDLPHNKINI